MEKIKRWIKALDEARNLQPESFKSDNGEVIARVTQHGLEITATEYGAHLMLEFDIALKLARYILKLDEV